MRWLLLQQRRMFTNKHWYLLQVRYSFQNKAILNICTIYNCLVLWIRCTDNYNGTRCEDALIITKSMLSVNKNTLRIIIYCLTITLFLCLLSIGVYYTTQKGYCKRRRNVSHSWSRASSAVDRSRPILHSNFSFNKLEEEEQCLAHQESEVVNA